MKLSNRNDHEALQRGSFVSAILIVITCFACSSMANAQPSRKMLNAVRIEPHIGDSLPLRVEFRNHLGEPIRLGEIVGRRPLVLCLVYFECPMLCKLAADGLVRSVAGLPETVGRDFDVAFVSFDPRDTPQRADAARNQALRRYARDESADGWHFLTGSQENIDQLTEAVGFHYVWDEESQQFAHAAGLMIVSPEGVIAEYLDGVHFSPRELISAVNRAANNQLSQDEPTSFVRCYLYDPTTGRFGAAVQWTIRLLGALTVVMLATAIFRLHRRGRVQLEQEQPR